ncbi:MFS transporter [Acinetobacter tibetensis]|uniref:MFS transporter n=1 Tax=Acinetobacter tibetensis TaxID=2943497 RepID=UPI003A4DCE60
MSQVDMQLLVSEAKFNRFHAKVLLWCMLIIIIDGYDISVAGAALPSIMEQMNVSASTAGFMASSALFGMMIGAIFFGGLADKIGRRLTIAICVFLFSVFTAAAGLTKDPVTFSIVRFIAGLGIGGVMPNVVAQMTEYSPKKVRNVMTSLMFSGYAIGGILAAILGKQFIIEYGWQVVFYAAGLPVLLLPFILKSMPESIGYLAKKNQQVELGRLAQQIEPKIGLMSGVVLVNGSNNSAAKPTVGLLFADGRAFSTLMFWVAFFTCLFMVYALSTWLTKLMAMSGYSLGSALTFVIALNVGAILGAVGGGWLADRFHIKWVLVIMYAVGSVFLYLMTLPMSVTMLYFIIAVVGACSTGAQIVAYSYCGQFYPSVIRSTGIGMASGVGRLGAIGAPLLIGLIVSLNLPIQQNFFVIALAGLIGAVALSLINHKRSAMT